MFTPTTVTERLLFSTVRIEAETKDGATNLGTAFCFDIRDGEGRLLPVLVTNNHVVSGTVVGRVAFHEALSKEDESIPIDRSISISLDRFGSRWTPHPDPDMDLCIMPLAPILRVADDLGRPVFRVTLTRELIPSLAQLDELDAVEPVLMVGYPTGLWDQRNNLPIIRRGITASHPAVDFDGRRVGLVDMACFPGSSGSPVLLYERGAYGKKGGPISFGTRALFLGVVFAMATFKADGTIEIRDIPTASVPVPIMYQPIHLGYYVKASAIIEVCDRFIETARPSAPLRLQ